MAQFLFRLFACAAGSCLATSCTVITVDGDAKVSRIAFGVVRVLPGANPQATVYRTRGLGIVPGRDGVTIGVRDETAALVWKRDDCRIILFQPARADVAALREALSSIGTTPSELCIIGEK